MLTGNLYDSKNDILLGFSSFNITFPHPKNCMLNSLPFNICLIFYHQLLNRSNDIKHQLFNSSRNGHTQKRFCNITVVLVVV